MPGEGTQPRRLSLLQRTKNRVVPVGPRPWKLRFGIARGLTMTLDLEHSTRLYLGLYEIELNRHLRRLCRPGHRCFDVGGQYGYDALVLAKLARSEIITFEFEPELCERIAQTLEANPQLAPLVKVRRAFVGKVTSDDGSQLALDDAAYGAGGFVPDFIKMDIEGGELDALLGAERILAERQPNLIVEVHSPELEDGCGRLLREAGYRPRIVSPRSWAPDRRPAEHNRWLVAEGGPGNA